MQKVVIAIAPNVTVEIANDNIKRLIEQAAFWSELPSVCPLCKAPLVFFHRNPQDNDFWGQVCTGPVKHESSFGVYKKEEMGLYYKGQWQDAYGAYQQNAPAGAEGNDRPTYSPPADRPPVTDPIARNLGDMVSGKQLGMIRAIAREANIDAEKECSELMRCGIEELSKRAASDLIDHLQNLQRNASAPMRRAEEGPMRDRDGNIITAPGVAPTGAPIPAPAATLPEPPPNPPGHPADCKCSICDDIPF